MVQLAGTAPLLLVMAAALACRSSEPGPAPRPAAQTIKVAVIGGMVETGFWQAIVERYQAARGHRIEVVASGPKPVVIDAFARAASISSPCMLATR